MKKKWVGNRRKRFYSEMWGNAVWEGGACENPVRLSTHVKHVAPCWTHGAEYLVHARLDYCILSQICRNYFWARWFQVYIVTKELNVKISSEQPSKFWLLYFVNKLLAWIPSVVFPQYVFSWKFSWELWIFLWNPH